MGRMQSPVKDIEYLEFNRLPTKPMKGTYVHADGVHLLVGDRGSLYTNLQPLSRKVWCSGAWEWSESVTAALLALKVITTDQHSVHLAWVTTCRQRSESVSALGELMRAAKVKGSGVRRSQLVKLWDSLDWCGQRSARRYGYQPENTVLKDQPAA